MTGKREQPTCLCRSEGEMTLIMEDKYIEFWHCPTCGRLLHKNKLSEAQAWYVPEGRLAGDWRIE